MLENVIARFGLPSIRWGTNDYYPCTLLYLCEAESERYVHFDFWADWFKNEKGLQLPSKYGPKPLLRNLRVPAATFPEEFVFSKFGESLKKSRIKSTSDE